MLAQVDTPSAPDDTLYLSASHDGGQTFGPAVLVPQGAPPFAFYAAGFSFDLASGIAIGELSDTVPVTIP